MDISLGNDGSSSHGVVDVVLVVEVVEVVLLLERG